MRLGGLPLQAGQAVDFRSWILVEWGQRDLQDGVLTVNGQAIDPQPVPAWGIWQREY